MKGFLLVLLAGCLGGCIQFKQLGADTAVGPGEAVVVLGVSPRSRLSVFAGELKGGQWNCTSLVNVANVWSEDGFIVLKLPPRIGTKNYAIGQILPDGIGGGSFVLQRGSVVPVFNAPTDAVTYVGSIKLSRYERAYGLDRDASVSISDVATVLARKYPALPKNIAEAPLRMIEADGGC